MHLLLMQVDSDRPWGVLKRAECGSGLAGDYAAKQELEAEQRRWQSSHYPCANFKILPEEELEAFLAKEKPED